MHPSHASSQAKTAVAPLDRVKILFQASNPDFQKYTGLRTMTILIFTKLILPEDHGQVHSELVSPSIEMEELEDFFRAIRPLSCVYFLMLLSSLWLMISGDS